MQPTNERLRFGPFTLDPAARRLSGNGQSAHLAPKSCDLLLLLTRNSGRVLGKEEIFAAIWPGVAVEEGNLTQHISLLRKLLGDPPHGGRYIETVPKTGYRFLQPIAWLPRAQPPPSRSRLAVFALLFLGSAFAFYWLGRASAPRHTLWIVPLSGGPSAVGVQATLLAEAQRFPFYRVRLEVTPHPHPGDLVLRGSLRDAAGAAVVAFEIAAPDSPHAPCRYTGDADASRIRAAFHACMHDSAYLKAILSIWEPFPKDFRPLLALQGSWRTETFSGKVGI